MRLAPRRWLIFRFFWFLIIPFRLIIAPYQPVIFVKRLVYLLLIIPLGMEFAPAHTKRYPGNHREQRDQTPEETRTQHKKRPVADRSQTALPLDFKSVALERIPEGIEIASALLP